MADHAPHGAAPKQNKPSNSNFRQQRLVAWQPIMSPPHVVACLLVIAVAFAPVGIAILFANKDALDIEMRYDDISKCGGVQNNSNGLFQWTDNGNTYSMGCQTVVNITVSETMPAPVYLYYKLTNFYQNHRRFAKSRSVSQLAGTDPSSMSDCDPVLKPGDLNDRTGTSLVVSGQNTTYSNMKYSPCGLVAWSMFNDTFKLYRDTASGPQLICNGEHFSRFDNQPLSALSGNCTKEGITWASDSEKFKSPAIGDNIWTADRAIYGLPNVSTNDLYLRNGWYANEMGHPVPAITDHDLQVWMRTAALPTFRKLYRVINQDLTPGQYTMVINEFYPVDSFDGRKYFALSTLSWLGGKNQFLGIAYCVVAGVSFVLAVVFFVAYKVTGDRMQNAIDSLSELR